MKKLEDITYRHELIERYLDADTSVEEEQALADFYRHCENKDLTDEDLDIRNLMLGMENYTPNILLTEEEMMEKLDRKEEMKELDRKEGADGQLQMKEMSLAASKKHETRWIRLSAILLATAMLAGLIFPYQGLFLILFRTTWLRQSGSYRACGSLTAIFQRWKRESEYIRKDGTCRLPLPGSYPGYRDSAGDEDKQDCPCQKKEYRRKKREPYREDCRKYRRDLF